MFSKCIAKLFALEPAATAVEAGVIAAILLTGLCCLLLATGELGRIALSFRPRRSDDRVSLTALSPYVPRFRTASTA